MFFSHNKPAPAEFISSETNQQKGSIKDNNLFGRQAYVEFMLARKILVIIREPIWLTHAGKVNPALVGKAWQSLLGNQTDLSYQTYSLHLKGGV